MKKKMIIVCGILLFGVLITSKLILDYREELKCKERQNNGMFPHFTVEKPVLYIYPEETIDVKVKLHLDGELTYTYPQYNVEWNVTADTTGKLYSDSKTYDYLFWEASVDTSKLDNFSKGFCVAGTDITEFLEEKLSYMGLSDSEMNDFITYWAPRMCTNTYNLVSFNLKEYEKMARYEITPNPETFIRVFMTYKAVDVPVDIPEQELEKHERSGYTIVEWGGTEIY